MSWDLALTLFFIIVAAFALIIGRARIVLVLLSAYAGIAVAATAGSSFLGFATKLFEGASLFVVKSVVFSAVTLLLVLRGEFSADGGASKKLVDTGVTVAYGVLMAGMSLVTVFSFMPEKQLNALFEASQFASRINDFRFWWLLLPVILMVSTSFLTPPAPDKK